MADTTDSITKELKPDKRAIETLRTITKKAVQEAEETVKWHAVTYIYNGSNITGLHVYKDHVNIGFFKGAMIKSPMLEGTGKGFRHIKVWKISELEEKEAAKLLKASVEFA